MTKIIKKSKAEGKIFAPSSKSAAHRMLIAAAMCDGEVSIIDDLSPSDDVLATIDCLRALGVKIIYENKTATVLGVDFTSLSQKSELYCRESGSTIRFLIPLLWLSGEEFVLSGSERLLERPMTAYEDIAKEHGFVFKREKDKIITKGKLQSGIYSLPGNISSQFISGLLLALSLTNGQSEIVVTTEIQSKNYIDITISVMKSFGIDVIMKDNRIYVRGGKYTAQKLSVEGDYSNAAFLDAFNYLGGNVEICGLNPDSVQGDKVYSDLFCRLEKGFCEINLSNCPDLGPILFTLAALKSGAKFKGTKRLRHKESDRIYSMTSELSKFGAEFIIEDDSLTVIKSDLHKPSEVLFGHNDHRVVMSLSVICSVLGGEISGAEAVNKSYPDFFNDLTLLGIMHLDG